MLKRSFSLAGHRTSVALEAEFWSALEIIASQRDLSLAALLVEVDQNRDTQNLSSALRLAALEHFRDQANTGP